MVTGKPIDLGGSKGRAEATGRGCMIVTEQALRKLGLERSATRVVIQGFGNVGGMAAKLMARAGFKIVCIIEYDGAVYNAKGLDIPALTKHRNETGSIIGFDGGEANRQNEAMFLETDVLLPAAKENVITSQNAHRLRTKILCEGANGPTTHVADSDPCGKRDLRDPRYSGQRGRRHRLLFRMGAGPPGLLLERADGQRSPGRNHGQQLPRRGRLRAKSTA